MTLNKCINHQQNGQGRNPGPVNSAGLKLLNAGPAFPKSSNVGGGSTRISVDQITGPNRSGKVGTFRQVRALILGGENAGVTTRRWSPPGAVFFGSREDGQREARVDSLNCTEAHGVLAEDVVDANQVCFDLNLWKPEHNNRQVAKKHHDWKRPKGSANALADAANKPGQRQNADANPGQNSGKPRVKNFHVNTLASIQGARVGI